MGRSATLAVFLCGCQLLAYAASNRPGPKVGPFRSLPTKFWVESAIQDAEERLRDPECQRLFSKFRDPLGISLEAKLTALGVSAEKYLTEWVYFVDGSDERQCGPKFHVVAFTQRGGRAIFICPPIGTDPAFSAARRGAPVIIHEMLHSLGLGENPPSSREITETVVRQCGG